ncbi:aldolase [Patescibacteria group bacterium]|nr:aldolase [Patescibacteria group bacterium]
MDNLIIPLSVPKNKEKEYKKNWQIATKKTGKLLLFAGDQKIEHLNDDFVGKGISKEDEHPEHLFNIASEANIGVFASHLGLISRYARKHKNIPYVVKMNGKTNLYKTKDAHSQALSSISDVIKLKQDNKLNIVGVGYTIYLGSKYEKEMLSEASSIIFKAQQEGLLTILWIYPRGPHIKNDEDIHLNAGAAGVANVLGADFVKLKYPYTKNTADTAQKYQEVIKAAGNTNVICVGGSQKKVNDYLKLVYEQINKAKSGGVAVGRNIHQRSLKDAKNLVNALSAIIYDNKSLKEAEKIYKKDIK